jgi:Icc-related predicted phosphoesterase
MADVHVGTDSAGTIRPALEGIEERADALLIAGDLTRVGDPDEARVLADELRGTPIPMIAVLGNHDYHLGRERDVARIIAEAGVTMLEGDTAMVTVDGSVLGVAGVKGFGGGFIGGHATAFGEPEMKVFVEHTRAIADQLGRALSSIAADARVALVHYAPVADTLAGERLEIYPFLGSFLLGEAIDHAGADLALHGHAHAGTEHGTTAGGIPVRNVAMPVIGEVYRVYCLGGAGECTDDSGDALSSRKPVETRR